MANTTLDALEQPANPHDRVWRYMDIPKLLSFLWTRSLYFSRLADLSDPFEGRLPSHAMPAIDQEFLRTERLCGREPGENHGYASLVAKFARTSLFVNCWCRQEDESEALWRIYGQPSGVALTTTYARLAGALPDSFYIGCVRYIDYGVDAPTSDNLFNLAMHKRRFFDYEREVRVFTQALPQTRDLDSLRNHRGPPFQTHGVPFDAFEGIVVSPYANRDFVNIVIDLAQRYECPIPVRASRMSLGPADLV